MTTHDTPSASPPEGEHSGAPSPTSDVDLEKASDGGPTQPRADDQHLGDQHREPKSLRQRLHMGGGLGTDALRASRRSVRPPSRRSRTLADEPTTFWGKVENWVGRHLNFYRFHVLFFVSVPLVMSGIFYASNVTPIPYIDCLFICFSAMTLTGLATFNISTSTVWQQVILFLLMCVGNVSIISLVMVLTRRHFMRKRFDYVIKHDARARRRLADVEAAQRKAAKAQHKKGWGQSGGEGADGGGAADVSPSSSEDEPRRTAKRKAGPLRADMIRRTDAPAVPVNSQGVPTERHEEPAVTAATTAAAEPEAADAEEHPGAPRRRGSLMFVDTPSSPTKQGLPARARGSNTTEGEDRMPRTHTVEFASTPSNLDVDMPRSLTFDASAQRPRRRLSIGGASSTGGASELSGAVSGVPRSARLRPRAAKDRGFGGFPMPLEVAGSALRRALPGLQRTFTRTTTMPRTSTMASTHLGGGAGAMPSVETRSQQPYLSFDVTVSGNSRFHMLSEAQRDELGGVEYRAIDLLAKLIPCYILANVLVMFVLVAPWLASRSAVTFNSVRTGQTASVPNSTWFWLFQVTSAYSNTGLSLLDTSFTQLTSQYFMMIPVGYLILAGNTAFPVLLRLFLWALSLCVPKGGRSYETLRFLLDHPRRCYLYLFPSAQTWFLLMVLVTLNGIDWAAFLILDIGNQALEMIPLNVRVFDGLFQSIAVRTAGFQVVSLLTIAPAVQFLYVVMMYISAYPVSMSLRNTNVYEERSLGVFSDGHHFRDGEEEAPTRGDVKVWGNHLAAHVRHQLAFDMWWLGLALWLICIIERTNIADPATNNWFTIFSCLFELTSAYGTVGLSTGTPFDNFSLSGRFRKLSKLVVVLVMLRGRHRGLPVAIDRAVLLPSEVDVYDEEHDEVMTLDERDWDVLERAQSTSATTTVMSALRGGGGGSGSSGSNEVEGAMGDPQRPPLGGTDARSSTWTGATPGVAASPAVLTPID